VIRDAHAIVGAPLTPVSVAGVARRTTVRAASATAATSQQQAATAQQQQATAQQQAATAQQQAATAQQQQAAAARPAGAPAVGTVVNALPAGCEPETKGGVEYQNCGGVSTALPSRATTWSTSRSNVVATCLGVADEMRV
jgi:multidrug efflux pump subunit AcrA (membrane-fusion protein)